MIEIIIVVTYSLAILISIILFLMYRSWNKKQNSSTLYGRPSSSNLSVKSGIDNFKIVNKC